MELFSVRLFLPLFMAFIAVFAIRELVTYRGLLQLKYLFTPAVTATIAGLVILAMFEEGATGYRALVLSALILSLVADTLLMVVEVDLMKQGIVFFMLAHVLYIAAFTLSYEYRPWNLAAVALLGALLLVFYRGIGRTAGAMRIPIMIYALVLCVMLFFALAGIGPDMTQREYLVVPGALLFVISDFLLAYLSFMRPHPHESVIVWAVYAPGQLMIALSCFS